MASFQCSPPVWLPVWGGVHTSGSSLLSYFSESGGFLCSVREQRGWAPCEALRAAPVEAQRSSKETQHSCAPECYPHTPVLCFLQTSSVCVFPHFPHSQSKLSQCEEALLKIQMLPLPLPDFQVLSWGPVNCMPFKMHFQHFKDKMIARKFISTCGAEYLVRQSQIDSKKAVKPKLGHRQV